LAVQKYFTDYAPVLHSCQEKLHFSKQKLCLKTADLRLASTYFSTTAKYNSPNNLINGFQRHKQLKLPNIFLSLFGATKIIYR